MLNASIVLYKNNIQEIKSLIEILQKAQNVSKIFIVDNSPLPLINNQISGIEYIFNNRNLGYGAAHNIALRKTLEENTPYHLVVNPDISLDANDLKVIEEFLNNNKEVGQLMPKVLYPDGRVQHLCKLIPSPFDLIIRRFIPTFITKKQQERFELHCSGYNKIMNIPYLSGCFMVLRTEALKEVGLFDERFFMYPEDLDLTRRIHLTYKTIFFPEVTIIHHHTKASYKSPKMLFIHIVNMIRYFNKWGWFFDKDRSRINKNVVKTINKQD